MTGRTSASSPTAWPPRDDPTTWRGLALALALPLLAWILGRPFWLAVGEGGAFRATSPLAWASLVPVLGLALWLGLGRAFTLALALQTLAGLALLLTSFQLVPALFRAGQAGTGLEAETHLGVLVAHGIALATGTVFTALGAYLLRRRLSATT